MFKRITQLSSVRFRYHIPRDFQYVSKKMNKSPYSLQLRSTNEFHSKIMAIFKEKRSLLRFELFADTNPSEIEHDKWPIYS